MTKEEVLKAMQEYVLHLKDISARAKLIAEELSKLNPEDQKWYEDNYRKWLIAQALTAQALTK